MLAAGALIDRYELVCPIGEGGMAAVWIARQRGTHGFEKLVALKAIHSRFANDPKFRAMFMDEARLASSIEHRNIAQVYDLGEWQSLLFLVMEYVDGESLAALLNSAAKKTGKVATIPPGTALRIVADVCAGLQAAHKVTDGEGKLRNVVHRDVSPQNVLVSTKGDVKLIDFGIALMEDRAAADTEEGLIKGKLRYMSPEQARNERIGPATDIFAAGAILYRILGGRPPYEGGSDALTLHALMSGRPPPPLPDSVNPLLSAICERALSPDPDDRYESAAAMQNAVESAIVDLKLIPQVASWMRENASDHFGARAGQLTKKRSPELPAIPDLAPPARTEPPPVAQRGEEEAQKEQHVEPVFDRQRSFMDVRELAAKQSSGPVAPPAPPAQPPRQKQPPVQAKDVTPDAGPKYVGPATPAVDGPRRGRGALLGAAGIGVVLILVVLGVVLPIVVRERAIASAREIGVELGIDSVGVGFGGITLRGLSATLPRMPGVSAKAEFVHASGFGAEEITMRGIDVTIDRAASDVGPELVMFADAARAHFAGTPTSPRKVTLTNVHVAWNDVLGKGTGIDAREVGATLDTRGLGAEDTRFSVGSFRVKTGRTELGPWAFVLETNPTATRHRLLFDPPVPDGPSALYVYGPNVAPKLTIKIPRSPVARLGLRPEELGLPGDPGTEIELKLEGERTLSGRLEGSGKLDVFAARLPNVKNPIDLHVEAVAVGQPGKSLDLDKAVATVGPFTANIIGTLTPHEQGFRLDATWQTLPIPCEKLVRAEAKTMGPFATTLQELAQRTGAARVYGSAQASGLILYDTRSPDDGTFSVTTKEACGLSLFGL